MQVHSSGSLRSHLAFKNSWHWRADSHFTHDISNFSDANSRHFGPWSHLGDWQLYKVPSQRGTSISSRKRLMAFPDNHREAWSLSVSFMSHLAVCVKPDNPGALYGHANNTFQQKGKNLLRKEVEEEKVGREEEYFHPLRGNVRCGMWFLDKG